MIEAFSQCVQFGEIDRQFGDCAGKQPLKAAGDTGKLLITGAKVPCTVQFLQKKASRQRILGAVQEVLIGVLKPLSLKVLDDRHHPVGTGIGRRHSQRLNAGQVLPDAFSWAGRMMGLHEIRLEWTEHNEMSRVAWIGRASWVGLLALGLALHLQWAEASPVTAWIALFTAAWLPGLAMGLGSMVAATVIKTNTPQDSASAFEWCRAVVREWWVYFPVFGWRQPFRWHAMPDHPADPGQPTVVLVHGYLCNRGFWHPWRDALQAQRWGQVSVNLEPVFGSIDDMVDVLDPVMQRALASGGPVAVVAHSMGGLVFRAWLGRQPQWPKALATVVTIGSPHQGTWVARWATSDAGQQMRMDSDWIAALRDKESPDDAARFLCWRSLTDHVVFPPSVATLPGAHDRVVRCAGHVDLAFQPQVMSESVAWIASAFRSPAARTRS